MFYLIYILIVGISFAPFIFPKIDIWHAQGIWVQIMTLLIFSWSLFEKSKFKNENLPITLLNLWVGGSTAFICFVAQHKKYYDIKHFFPYFNFLCLMIIYKAIVEYLDDRQIKKINEAMRYVIIATLIICSLQYFGLAQFFVFICRQDWYHPGAVVGFIGNGTHLSGFLATAIPLFMIWNRENIFCLTLMFIILCFSGTTVGDPAISGFIVAISIFILAFVKSRKVLLVLFLSIVSCAVLAMILVPNDVLMRFLSMNGRNELWGFYLGLATQLKGFALTGFGLGAINQIYKDTPFENIRHLHMEYFQFMFELGIIGALLILNVINSFINLRINSINKLMVYGFLISCCFNYPAHLWLPATWAVFCYAAVFVERNNKIAIN